MKREQLIPIARYTTTLRDQSEIFERVCFPETYSFYTDNEQIKFDFEEKYLAHFWTEDVEGRSFEEYLHMFYGRMAVIMPKYKQIFELELDKFELNNVDITEIIKNETVGSVKATNDAKSQNDTNGKSDVWTRDADTPQGNISKELFDSYVSNMGKSDTNTSGKSNSTSEGNSKQDSDVKADTHRTLKGYQGNLTLGELKYNLINKIVNIDEMIIQDCERLFLKIR